MATKRQRYMISVDDEMFNAIEDFRFEHRFQTRSEATTELIRLGLETIEKQKKNKEIKNHTSDTNEEEKTELVTLVAYGGNGVEGRYYTKKQIEKLEELIKRDEAKDK